MAQFSLHDAAASRRRRHKENTMKKLTTALAWLLLALVAALAALNWATLMQPAPINLLLIDIQAPLGLVMLGVTAILVALFGLAYMHGQIGQLLETRRLLKEIQRVQGLADQAEASRVGQLSEQMTREFARLHERLDQAPPASVAGADRPPTGAPFGG
jgi:uncharacterized integral membrane protein